MIFFYLSTSIGQYGVAFVRRIEYRRISILKGITHGLLPTDCPAHGGKCLRKISIPADKLPRRLGQTADGLGKEQFDGHQEHKDHTAHREANYSTSLTGNRG